MMTETKTEKRSGRALRILTTIIFVLAVITYFASVQLAGGSVLRFLRYAVIFCLMLLPGLRVTELCMPKIGTAAKISVGYAAGVGLLFLSYITFGRLHPLATALPLLPLAVWQIVLFFCRKTSPFPAVKQHPAVPLLLLAFSGALFIFCFTGVLPFARASAVGNMVYHQDMMFSVGNAAAVQLGSPLVNIRTFGSHMQYHYLGDALPGFAAMFSGVLPYEALCYYNYPMLALLMTAGIYAAARKYGASVRMASLLPFLLFFVHGYSSQMTHELLRNMNGVATATALSAAVLIFFFSADQEKTCTRGFVLCFSLSMLALLMSKNLYGILMCCAAGAAFLFSALFQKKIYKKGLLLAGIGSALTLLCWLTVFRFAANNLVCESWITVPDFLKRVFFTQPLTVLLWLISIPVSLAALCRHKKLTFSRLLVNAAAIGGLLAFFLFHHYSGSQDYFLLAAILFMWFAVLDLEPFLAKLRWGQVVCAVLAGLCLCGTAVSLLPDGQKGVQVVLRSLHLRPQYPRDLQTVTAADEEAALWLRKNMKPDEIFATNRNSREPIEAKEGLWHYCSGMSGRQCYMEGWLASLNYGHDFYQACYQLEDVNDVMYAFDDAAPAFQMAKEHDIDYLFVEKFLKERPFKGAEPVFENEDVRIYKVE